MRPPPALRQLVAGLAAAVIAASPLAPPPSSVAASGTDPGRHLPSVRGAATAARTMPTSSRPSERVRALRPTFLALSGDDAAAFVVPPGMRLVRDGLAGGDGLTYERYQQVTAGPRADVIGGQLTLYRQRDGTIALVLGRVFPAVRPVNRVAIGSTQARERVALAGEFRGLDGPTHPGRSARLMLDPVAGRYVYRVESRSLGVRWFHDVDAATGQTVRRVDALAEDHGTGVKGDRKELAGSTTTTADDLAWRYSATEWELRSRDGRVRSFTARNGTTGVHSLFDSDGHWTASSHRAAVDAHVYAAVTDRYFRARLGFDIKSTACGYGSIKSVVHYGQSYANAFWDGAYVVYGDGDGDFRPMSGGQDVVTHELAHALTECTSSLDYVEESGALNEAFSDILASSAEQWTGEGLTSNCRRAVGQSTCPDWLIGEDVALMPDAAIGFRNMADPGEDGQPDHYSELVAHAEDNGGVHANSGIPNHAYYLLVNGGRNAGCDARGSNGHRHADDCDVTVPPVPLADAEDIFYTAFTGLANTADFCDARAATAAAARTLFPAARHEAAVRLAWAAVGLGDTRCEPGYAPLRLMTANRTGLVGAGGGATRFDLQLSRDTDDGTPVAVTVSGLPAGASATVEPATHAGVGTHRVAVTVTVPATLDAGTYPLKVHAESATQQTTMDTALVFDRVAPTAVAPVASLAAGTSLGTGALALPVRMTWSGTDVMTEVVRYRLQISSDGGAHWSDVPVASPEATTGVLSLDPGTYRARVMATDRAGNVSPAAAGPAFSIAAMHETDPAITYSGGWSAPPAAPAWGTVRYSRATGASATFRFTGRSVAWVAPRDTTRGRARVYLDGVLVQTLNLYATTPQPRRVVSVRSGLSTTGSHTIRVVVVGTPERPRVDIDGFIVLR